MTAKEILAFRCAHADLIGVLQAYEQGDLHAINTHAIKQTLDDIETVLPNIELTDWSDLAAK